MATSKGTETKDSRGAQAQQPAAQQQAGGAPQQAGAGSAAVAPRVERSVARAAAPSFGPFALMRRLFDDIEQLWGIGAPETAESAAEAMRTFMPPIEVARRGDKLMVRVDLPGMAPEDLDITVEDDALIIAGERRVESEILEEGQWRSERTYGEFQRVIPLPDGAEADSTEARFENGVLEISMRAPERPERGRKVEINKSPGAPAAGSRETH